MSLGSSIDSSVDNDADAQQEDSFAERDDDDEAAEASEEPYDSNPSDYEDAQQQQSQASRDSNASGEPMDEDVDDDDESRDSESDGGDETMTPSERSLLEDSAILEASERRVSGANVIANETGGEDISVSATVTLAPSGLNWAVQRRPPPAATSGRDRDRDGDRPPRIRSGIMRAMPATSATSTLRRRVPAYLNAYRDDDCKSVFFILSLLDLLYLFQEFC